MERGLEARRPTVRHIAGLGRARGMQRHLIYIHITKYAEVINASIAANSAIATPRHKLIHNPIPTSLPCQRSRAHTYPSLHLCFAVKIFCDECIR